MTEPHHVELELRRTERYLVYEAIAKGGMATVHLGLLQGAFGFSRLVAIKRLHANFTSDPRIVGMLIEEARLVSRIRHINVVPTLDVIQSSGEVFVVMEYVCGAPLARLLRDAAKRGSLIPVPTLVTILTGALRGLHAAHRATDLEGAPLGIVHRDVSPQNILVGVGGLARIIDFGVAHAFTNQDKTRDGEFKGKLSYAAPEQISGEAVTPRTDVFAAGIVLWEMLTGERLFKGDSDFDTYRNVLLQEIVDPRRLYEGDAKMRAARSQAEIDALGAIAMKALQRDPASRFASAQEMSLALAGAAKGAPLPEVGEWVKLCAADRIAREQSMVSMIERRAEDRRGATPAPTVLPLLGSASLEGAPAPSRDAAPARSPDPAPGPPPSAAGDGSPWPSIPFVAAAVLVLAASLGGALAGAALGHAPDTAAQGR